MPLWHVFEGGIGSALEAAFFPFVHPDPPTGEGAGTFLDILFRIISFSKGEELEKFPGKIFIWGFCPAFGSIEIEQHGWILCHSQNQIRPHTVGFFTKQRVLLIQKEGAADLFKTSGKVAVEKEGEFFPRGSGRLRHLLEPPAAELGHLAALISPQILGDFSLCICLGRIRKGVEFDSL